MACFLSLHNQLINSQKSNHLQIVAVLQVPLQNWSFSCFPWLMLNGGFQKTLLPLPKCPQTDRRALLFWILNARFSELRACSDRQQFSIIPWLAVCTCQAFCRSFDWIERISPHVIGFTLHATRTWSFLWVVLKSASFIADYMKKLDIFTVKIHCSITTHLQWNSRLIGTNRLDFMCHVLRGSGQLNMKPLPAYCYMYCFC